MMKPRRIVFIAPFGLGQKTTVWARTLPLAQYLAGRGHTVSIVIPPWDTPAHAGKRWQEGGVHLINVALLGGIPAILRRLLGQVDNAQPDIVHIVKPRAYAGLAQWWLWQRRRIRGVGPYILLDVDDWEQAWAPINGYSWPLARFLAWQEEWGIRHAHGISAASRWLVSRMQTAMPQTPVVYLPNGIALPDSTSSSLVGQRRGESPKNVLFFTRFVEVEPEWLADFWQELQEQVPETRLFVAGRAFRPGYEAEYQKRLIALLGREDSTPGIDWLGYVDPRRLVDLYARVSCAIFPAADIPLHQAKCSVRLATTLLHGVPVVASAVGEQAEYGAHGAACLVPPEATPAQFAQAVAALLRRPEQQEILSAQARRRLLTHYDWARLGAQLEEFYERAIILRVAFSSQIFDG